MPQHVIEGTWEDIERHKAELAGQWLRVTYKPQKPTKPKLSEKPAKVITKPKELRGYGMFAGLLSTEEYFREKRKDTIREDRSL